MKILITGTAGFIGFHLAKKLLNMQHTVVGLDNVNDYYDVSLKLDRLNDTGISGINDKQLVQSSKYPGYRFIKADLTDRDTIDNLFEQEKFDVVINLAAQSGVRHMVEQLANYVDTNITGFINILEGCRHHDGKHLIYESSTAVYGTNADLPFSKEDRVDTPV